MLAILRLVTILAILVGVGLFLTRPQRVDADLLDGLTPDAERGALVTLVWGYFCFIPMMLDLVHGPRTSSQSRAPLFVVWIAFYSFMGYMLIPRAAEDWWPGHC